MTYYRKMTIVPTRAGLMYECRYCAVSLAPEEADQHTEADCLALQESVDAVSDPR
jgi:hypothetical protein